MNKIIKKSFISIFLVSLIYSCGESATSIKVSPTPTPSYPLFLRLGNNKEAISVIIDDTFQNVAINDTIKAQFTDILNDPNRLNQLKSNLVDYVCQVSGGGCVYNNANNTQVVVNLDANQYTSFKADLNKTLDKFKILNEDRNDLNNVFDPSKVGIFTIVTATPVPATTPTGSSSPLASPSVIVSGQPIETSPSPVVSPEVSVSPTVSASASPQIITSSSTSITN